ncbi:unnamed protein product [Dovyalis caffra]|uniref:B30.2/SPRY domain-containing protein n=1 Tax=Dovyalis caffra TaxID=77055 RepID=A0AAV1RPV0_9ROSI|nr:unnamed protein product [Dovyalis caffra]
MGGGVLLGMPGPWADDNREPSDFYTSKIGGLPDWPFFSEHLAPNLLICGACGSKIRLIAQVYGPISIGTLNIEDRTVLVFGCICQIVEKPLLGVFKFHFLVNHFWRALRVQKVDIERESSTSTEDVVPSTPPVSVSKANWLDDDSDEDIDLEVLGKALSEVGTLASHSKKQDGNRRSEPVVKEFHFGAKDRSRQWKRLEKQNCDYNDHEMEDEGEQEVCEYDKALSADWTYLKFKKQLDANPDQCFRYLYGGKPLLPTAQLVDPGKCKLCGGFRHFEMQVMPQLISFLLDGADDCQKNVLENWNWMTIVVYTCSKPLDELYPGGFDSTGYAGIEEGKTWLVVPTHMIKKNPQPMAGLRQRKLFRKWGVLVVGEMIICGDIRIIKCPLLVESLVALGPMLVFGKGNGCMRYYWKLPSVQQLRWATRSCPFTGHKGVEDADDSYAFDGKRVSKWNKDAEQYGQPWVVGDVIGCCVDLDHDEILFYRNGASRGDAFRGICKMGPGYGHYPAISLSQSELNFGSRPFKYPVPRFLFLKAPLSANLLTMQLLQCLSRLSDTQETDQAESSLVGEVRRLKRFVLLEQDALATQCHRNKANTNIEQTKPRKRMKRHPKSEKEVKWNSGEAFHKNGVACEGNGYNGVLVELHSRSSDGKKSTNIFEMYNEMALVTRQDMAIGNFVKSFNDINLVESFEMESTTPGEVDIGKGKEASTTKYAFERRSHQKRGYETEESITSILDVKVREVAEQFMF